MNVIFKVIGATAGSAMRCNAAIETLMQYQAEILAKLNNTKKADELARINKTYMAKAKAAEAKAHELTGD